MNKPKTRKRCYDAINNFINFSKSHEIQCDIVLSSNEKVMILWNVPVKFQELLFKEDENFFDISVWWNESENRIGDLIPDDELPDTFDSRFLTPTSYGRSDIIDFSNSWKTMIRCSFVIHQDSNAVKVLSIADEYKTCQ